MEITDTKPIAYKELKPEIDRQNRIRTILSIASTIISILSLTATIILGMFIYAQDYEKQAISGNIKAQLFLADHYYETGNYVQCMYWYKIIAGGNNKYRDIANQNIGYLLSRKLGTSSEMNDDDRWARANEYYSEAIKGGDIGIVKNYLAFLYSVLMDQYEHNTFEFSKFSNAEDTMIELCAEYELDFNYYIPDILEDSRFDSADLHTVYHGETQSSELDNDNAESEFYPSEEYVEITILIQNVKCQIRYIGSESKTVYENGFYTLETTPIYTTVLQPDYAKKYIVVSALIKKQDYYVISNSYIKPT